MRRPKVFFLAILSSTAAGLRVPFYLAATSVCKEKVYLRLGTGYASGVYLGLLSVLSAAAVCSSSQTGAAKGGEIVPFSHKLPLLPRPTGLPARHLCLSTKCPSGDQYFRFSYCGVIGCVPRRERLVPINIYTSVGSPGGIAADSP